jgi:hypothetical protein
MKDDRPWFKSYSWWFVKFWFLSQIGFQGWLLITERRIHIQFDLNVVIFFIAGALAWIWHFPAESPDIPTSLDREKPVDVNVEEIKEEKSEQGSGLNI